MATNYDAIAQQLLNLASTSFQQAKAANENRYREIIAGYDDIIGKIPGTFDEALKAGQSAISRRTTQGLAQADQTFISRGLYNTTAMDAARRSALLGGQLESISLAADYGAKQAQLESSVRGQKLLAMSNRQDLYLDPSLYANIAFQLGQATGSNSNFNSNVGGIGGGSGSSLSIGRGSSLNPYEGLNSSTEDYMRDMQNRISGGSGSGASGSSGGWSSGGYGGSYIGSGSSSSGSSGSGALPGFGRDPTAEERAASSYRSGTWSQRDDGNWYDAQGRQVDPDTGKPIYDASTIIGDMPLDRPGSQPIPKEPSGGGSSGSVVDPDLYRPPGGKSAPSGYKWTSDGRLILVGGVYDTTA